MNFTDDELNSLAEKLSDLINEYSRLHNNAPILLLFGAREDDDSTIKLMVNTPNLKFDEAARIATGCIGLISDAYGNV